MSHSIKIKNRFARRSAREQPARCPATNIHTVIFCWWEHRRICNSIRFDIPLATRTALELTKHCFWNVYQYVISVSENIDEFAIQSDRTRGWQQEPLFNFQSIALETFLNACFPFVRTSMNLRFDQIWYAGCNMNRSRTAKTLPLKRFSMYGFTIQSELM